MVPAPLVHTGGAAASLPRPVLAPQAPHGMPSLRHRPRGCVRCWLASQPGAAASPQPQPSRFEFPPRAPKQSGATLLPPPPRHAPPSPASPEPTPPQRSTPPGEGTSGHTPGRGSAAAAPSGPSGSPGTGPHTRPQHASQRPADASGGAGAAATAAGAGGRRSAPALTSSSSDQQDDDEQRVLSGSRASTSGRGRGRADRPAQPGAAPGAGAAAAGHQPHSGPGQQQDEGQQQGQQRPRDRKLGRRQLLQARRPPDVVRRARELSPPRPQLPAAPPAAPRLQHVAASPPDAALLAALVPPQPASALLLPAASLALPPSTPIGVFAGSSTSTGGGVDGTLRALQTYAGSTGSSSATAAMPGGPRRDGRSVAEQSGGQGQAGPLARAHGHGQGRQQRLRVAQDRRYVLQRSPIKPARPRAMELTEVICMAGQLEQLQDILDAHADHFNHRTVTTFCARLAQLAAAAGVGRTDGAPGGGGGGREELGAVGEDGEEAEAAEEPAAAPVARTGELDRGPARRLVELLAARAGDLAQLHLLQLDPKGTVIILHAYARMACRHDCLADLAYVAGRNADRLRPQGLANLVWALAALQPDSRGWAGRSWWEGLWLVSEGLLYEATSQGLANMAWALGSLRQRPPLAWQRALAAATVRRLPAFSAQGVATWVQGAAKMQLVPTPGLLDELMGYGQHHLSSFSHQGLVLYAWGMCHLHAAARTPQAALAPWLERCVLLGAQRRLSQLDGCQMTTLLYSLSQVRYVPRKGAFLRAFWNAMRSMLPPLKQGVGAWKVSGGGGGAGAGAGAGTAAQQRRAALEAQSAALGISIDLDLDPDDDDDGGGGGGGERRLSPGSLPAVLGGGRGALKAVATQEQEQEAARQGTPAEKGGAVAGTHGGAVAAALLDAQSVANLLQACAELQLQPPQREARRLLLRSQQLLPEFEPQALCSVVWSLSRLSLQPLPGWAPEFMRQAGRRLARMGPSDMAIMLQGLSRLGATPPAVWLERVELEWLQGMDRYGPLELYRCLTALASWGWRLGPDCQAALVKQLARSLAQLPPHQCARVLSSLADVGCRPPVALLNALVVAVMQGRAPAASELAQLVYGLAALGRQVSPRLLAALLASLDLCARTADDAIAAAAAAAAVPAAAGRRRRRGAGAPFSAAVASRGAGGSDDDIEGSAELSAAQVVDALWALTRFGLLPGPLWQRAAFAQVLQPAALGGLTHRRLAMLLEALCGMHDQQQQRGAQQAGAAHAPSAAVQAEQRQVLLHELFALGLVSEDGSPSVLCMAWAGAPAGSDGGEGGEARSAEVVAHRRLAVAVARYAGLP